MNKEAANLMEKAEAPDVFTIVSTSNKDNKMLIHEGDIAVGIGRSAIKCGGDTCRWSKNSTGTVIVPYTISSDFSSADVSVIHAAMQEFSTLTCVLFTPWTSEADFLQIISGTGCWSSVGKIGGSQAVSLGTGCVERGTMQHELNHALGFYHEQSRSDRDNYVDITLDNVLPGTEGNFQKFDTNNLGLEYDYLSLMHYGRYAFSKSPQTGLATIVPKPNSSKPIGQRYGLSSLDIAKINKLYNCGVCRALLPDTKGSVTSSNYPNNYPSNSNCLWLIRVPANQIILQFSAFDIQPSPACASDYLRIYDGYSRSSPVLLDRSCGAGQPPPMISSGNAMLIEFNSDKVTEATGFKASYSTVTCGTMLNGSMGSLSSPNYPSNYPPSMDCTWVITAPSGFMVSLNMTDFSLEVQRGCTYDYLLVFNGLQTTSPLIGKYCGTSILPSFTSSGNSLLLQFHSDNFIGTKGFLAKYAFVPQK
ncbi:embryonic protein UVS.2-like isoform X2 [Pseudophryne corroboree]